MHLICSYYIIDNLLSGWLDDYWKAIGLDDFIQERYERIGGMYTSVFYTIDLQIS